jgi:hypothetical protein
MHKKVESRRRSSGAEQAQYARQPGVDSPAADQPSPSTPTTIADGLSSKTRCKGVTRYGDPCRFWALPGSEFCYWCEQAGRPRYPLPAPTAEAAQAASRKELHKKRCQGVTVFGDQCRFWAVGSTDYCLWCSGQNRVRE